MNKRIGLSIPAVLFLGMLLVVSACSKTNDDQANTKPAAATDADNTARNADTSAAALTPLDQGESDSDRQISASIRKAVLADNSLSVNAHNVKIITSSGTVTLEGPVKSAHEKEVIEAKATAVAGVNKVNDRLEVEASK